VLVRVVPGAVMPTTRAGLDSRNHTLAGLAAAPPDEHRGTADHGQKPGQADDHAQRQCRLRQVSPTINGTIPIRLTAPAATVGAAGAGRGSARPRNFGSSRCRGTLDLIEPALVVLGERHDSFSLPAAGHA
jgi:hypothetical protein